MKKILSSVLVASLMLLTTSAFAQFSVGAGYVNSKTTLSSGSSTYSAPSNGFYAGFDYNVPVGDILGLSAGVNFEYLMSKDYKLAGVINGDFKEQYINVPVRINAGMNFGDGIRFLVFAGPTFSYGLAGPWEAGAGPVSVKGDVYKDNGWNRFDVLVGGGAGLELMDKIRLTVGYDLGMFNRLPEDSNDKVSRNRLHAGIALLF